MGFETAAAPLVPLAVSVGGETGLRVLLVYAWRAASGHEGQAAEKTWGWGVWGGEGSGGGEKGGA